MFGSGVAERILCTVMEKEECHHKFLSFYWRDLLYLLAFLTIVVVLILVVCMLFGYYFYFFQIIAILALDVVVSCIWPLIDYRTVMHRIKKRKK